MNVTECKSQVEVDQVVELCKQEGFKVLVLKMQADWFEVRFWK